ncbi:hypothetical protein [Mucilaginibacter paludis]|nr:hypothetical protein [Mucilaginibacter paludis]
MDIVKKIDQPKLFHISLSGKIFRNDNVRDVKWISFPSVHA